MKKILLIIIASCLLICGYAAKPFYNIFPLVGTTPARPAYNIMKQSISRLRLQLKENRYLTPALLEQRFTQVVIDSIIPYWYGTAWDFNGTTQSPGTGAIACGYFVSTVLRDAGLPVNREKMGQMDSEEMMHILAEKKDIRLFYEKPLAQVLVYLRQQGQGLYLIGLNSHVGFILVDAAGCWFIHAKWFGEKAVVKEDAATSNTLYYSTGSESLVAAFVSPMTH